MFKGAIEWAIEQTNENFQVAAEVDMYVVGLGGEALKFTKSVWDVSMVLAAVIFAIIACYELYAIAVRNEARGGPMGSAEVAFKVMFKVAVCYLLLQVSFDIPVNLYYTSNELTEAIGGIKFATSDAEPVLDWDELEDEVPSSFKGIGVFFFAIIVWFISWAAKWAAVILVLARMIQIYLYIAIAPIPLATFPSQEYSQIGKSFLKSFIAVCLQGALIYLVVRFLPAMTHTALNSGVFFTGGSLTADLSIAALLSATTLITLIGTQQIARRICNAM